MNALAIENRMGHCTANDRGVHKGVLDPLVGKQGPNTGSISSIAMEGGRCPVARGTVRTLGYPGSSWAMSKVSLTGRYSRPDLGTSTGIVED